MYDDQSDSFQAVTIDRLGWLRRAEQLLDLSKNGTVQRQARKNHRSVGFSNFLVNAPTLHIENELGDLLKIAEAYRNCGKWIDASETLAKAAWIQGNKLGFADESALLYTEAAACSEKVDGDNCEKYLRKAIICYCDLEKYGQAGRIREWIAQRHSDMKCYDSASTEFHEAAACYVANRMDLRALHCQREEAYLLGLLGKYNAASQLFSAIGQKELSHNLMKYNACESFFLSGLLLLSMGKSHFGTVKENIDKSMKVDHHFQTSSQCDFLHNLTKIVMDGNIHDFAEHVFNFDSVCPIDELCSRLLEKIKSFIEEN